MALIGVSDDLYVYAFVTCVMCERTIMTTEATAGPLLGDGSQSFTCNKHLADRAFWLTGWAAFNAKHGNTASMNISEAR